MGPYWSDCGYSIVIESMLDLQKLHPIHQSRQNSLRGKAEQEYVGFKIMWAGHIQMNETIIYSLSLGWDFFVCLACWTLSKFQLCYTYCCGWVHISAHGPFLLYVFKNSVLVHHHMQMAWMQNVLIGHITVDFKQACLYSFHWLHS